MVEQVTCITDGEEFVESQIEGVSFYRQNAPTECSVCVVEPSLAFVIQGSKQMALDEQTFRYDPTKYLITSLDLPAKMQVVEASDSQPYLGIVLKLDSAVNSELAAAITSTKHNQATSENAMILGSLSGDLFGALSRLVNLLNEPESIQVLAPLIKKEIFWRVLNSEQGARLRQIVANGSQGLRIAQAIEWLKINFNQHMNVDVLATMAKMSKSTFHHHFPNLLQ